MVNGGGFNPANANFPTDLTTDSNTGNTASPVVSSASYNFAAGDVGAWVYVKAGTNWTPGWYKIASVASNKATLDAAAGHAMQVNSVTGAFQPNSVAGCATVGTPTSGTYGIDYSQGTAAITTATNLVGALATSSAPTVTSLTQPFGIQHTGNIIHITAGTSWTTGWYEIVSVSTTTATLDRACGGTAAPTGGTFHVGGALSLNSTLDNAFFITTGIPAGSIIWFKNGSYTAGQSITISGPSAATAPILVIGYNALRGDNPTGSNRPTIALAANTLTLTSAISNLIITGTAAAMVTGSASIGGIELTNCKLVNTSSTAGRVALTPSGNSRGCVGCEFVSQNGIGVSSGGHALALFGCYLHDSVTGASSTLSSGVHVIVDCVFEGNTTADITDSGASQGTGTYANNTFYGREAQMGIGMNCSANSTATTGVAMINNIFYGKATAVLMNTATLLNADVNNNYFNNTAIGSLFSPWMSAKQIDPQFVGASQITGSAANTSGSVLTDSGANFSGVNDNVDFLHVTGGTGVTTGCYLITSHTATTLTVNNALGTDSSNDCTYWISNGHNFAIGANLKAGAVPSVFGGQTNSYLDIGAVQRQEANSNTSPVATPKIIQNIGTY